MASIKVEVLRMTHRNDYATLKWVCRVFGVRPRENIIVMISVCNAMVRNVRIHTLIY